MIGIGGFEGKLTNLSIRWDLGAGGQSRQSKVIERDNPSDAIPIILRIPGKGDRNGTYTAQCSFLRLGNTSPG